MTCFINKIVLNYFYISIYILIFTFTEQRFLCEMDFSGIASLKPIDFLSKNNIWKSKKTLFLKKNLNINDWSILLIVLHIIFITYIKKMKLCVTFRLD